MKKHLVLAALALAGTVGACTSDSARIAGDPRDARMCFLPRDLRNWKKDGELSVLFRARRDEIFRGDLLTPCFDLDFSTRITVHGVPGPWICDGDDADIVTYKVNRPDQRCHVVRIHGLTREQAAALGPDRLP